MKIQHLAVIFVLIMIPIAFVLSNYIGTQITTIQMQAQFDTRLYNATHDAINAFQINTMNNKFSSISDSKIRDIYASVNTYYNSLSNVFRKDGYTTKDLHEFTPAVVYTLYDGYYIYGQYENTEKALEEDKEKSDAYGYALKPMIYYSCRYHKGNIYDVVVNYTLDNYITVMGQIGSETVTKSGYFINPSIITRSPTPGLANKIQTAYEDFMKPPDGNWEDSQAHQLRREKRVFDTQVYMQNVLGWDIGTQASGGIGNILNGIELYSPNGNITIQPEILSEYLLFSEKEYEPENPKEPKPKREAQKYQYVVYNGQKYYLERGDLKNNIDITSEENKSVRYFQYDTNYEKLYVTPPSATVATKDSNFWIWQYLEFCRVGDTLYSTAAIDYYLNAYIFSDWVNSAMSNISVEDASGITLVREGTDESPKIEIQYTTITFPSTLSNPYIFAASDTNDPEAEASNFQEHRRNVIRHSIETNLATAIANYNLHTTNAGYQYVLPVLNEEDWEKVTHHISMITFLQGMPINGYKYYNNYCVLTNNKNKEFVGKTDIYLKIQMEEEGKSEAYAQEKEFAAIYEQNQQKHLPGCMSLMAESEFKTYKWQGYNITDYMRQNVKLDENTIDFFYQHYDTSCYSCILGANSIYDTEEIFQGRLYRYEDGQKVKNATGSYETLKTSASDAQFEKIRTAFMTALAREKHILVKTMGYFGS